MTEEKLTEAQMMRRWLKKIDGIGMQTPPKYEEGVGEEVVESQDDELAETEEEQSADLKKNESNSQVMRNSLDLLEKYRGGIIDTWPGQTIEVFELAHAGGQYKIFGETMQPEEAMKKFLAHLPEADVLSDKETEVVLTHPDYDYAVQVTLAVGNLDQHVFNLTMLNSRQLRDLA